MRQGEAASERKFVDDRLSMAGSDLRAAEDRLESFLSSNRQYSSTSELAFQRDRLQRDVSFRQQLVTTLTQASEDARIREVRDTPVITIFEPPFVPSDAEPRGRVKRVLLGIIIGALVGALISLGSAMVLTRREGGDREAELFFVQLGEIKREIRTPVKWLQFPRKWR
jgi:uncharacterized protein involved in exopolysaccharide biosynthesis